MNTHKQDKDNFLKEIEELQTFSFQFHEKFTQSRLTPNKDIGMAYLSKTEKSLNDSNIDDVNEFLSRSLIEDINLFTDYAPKIQQTSKQTEFGFSLDVDEKNALSKDKDTVNELNNCLYLLEQKSTRSFFQEECENPIIQLSINSHKKQQENCIKPEEGPKKQAKRGIKNDLKNLKALKCLLIKIFSWQEINEFDLDLSSAELQILNLLLYKKYLRKIPGDPANLNKISLLKCLQRITKVSSHKRPEECSKFIVTRAIKFLKKNFKKDMIGRKDIDTKFLSHYFRDQAKEMGLDLAEFEFPLWKKNGRKKFNINYFEKIFKSPKFLNDLVKYILEVLEESYLDELDSKLNRLLLKWDNEVKKGWLSEIQINRIRVYITQNNKSKLPWNFDEVRESVNRIYRLIDQFGDKTILTHLSTSKFLISDSFYFNY